MGSFLGMVGIGGFLLVLLFQTIDTTHPTADLKLGCRGAAQPDLARSIANKWGPVFGAPIDILLVIARIESGFRADCANYTLRALSRGGAVGMWQQTLATARGHATDLASSTNPLIVQTLAKWTGERSCLSDPDLCGMFAAKQLGELSRMFGGDLAAVAGAYHQGAGKIRAVLAAGGKLPDALPPLGKAYVTKALAVKAMG